jgi:hypothetical protein
MTFKQAMIAPTMATLGIGALLMAQNLSLMEVGYAAPAAPGAAPGMAPGASAPGKAGGRTDGAGALPMPSDAGISAEFGPQTGGKTISAISDAELAHRAVQNSGREDPFMALVPPDPGSIVPPPITFGAIKPIPPIAPIMPTGGADPKPSLPSVPTAGTPVMPPKPVIEDLPWAGDKAPAAQEPQWLVRGVMQIQNERITMLEGKDETIRAKVGDKLPDGSRVEAISSRGVTFIRGGRRFFKQIGGNP